MADLLDQPIAEAAAPSRYRLVDCDAHPITKSGLGELRPFLSQAAQRRLGLDERRNLTTIGHREAVSIPRNMLYLNPAGVLRDDARAPDGSAPGADPAFTAQQLLDGNGIDRAVLIGGEVLGLGAMPDPDAAAMIASAYNQWLATTWFDADDRYRGYIVVGAQDPVLAAQEIRRAAEDERFVGVLLPLTGILMGLRHYYPIYEAAHEVGIPVAVHPNSGEGIFRTSPPMAGGTPTYYVEWHSGLSQVFQANVISLVCHGVFERFPNLKVILTEGGLGWIPDVMWRLDKNVKGLRDEVPWVRRLPSEYVVDHVRFTTQPLPEPKRRHHLHVLCEIARADRTLMFSSDYPHWDFDDPRHALASLPSAIRQRVSSDNAVETYGDRL
ncbi:Predicted metal-dependent hydrolase, TIM-barrel fold [Micromonospora viridifaciens]|uniref:Predicted metal-dependent hydrolase, TIM-barrel fold n=1 Tax=Micromonospora viridifaciens TaxID=1881 RepID=A0A1C4WKP2_MICVI|nr:amidohydrolase family protein [Micromonospora viridifaciens]SCE96703.1 Predicted metal-dependent hydrolase, TIM-barrel fold [Micromonospora viridifaciens]